MKTEFWKAITLTTVIAVAASASTAALAANIQARQLGTEPPQDVRFANTLRASEGRKLPRKRPHGAPHPPHQAGPIEFDRLDHLERSACDRGQPTSNPDQRSAAQTPRARMATSALGKETHSPSRA